MARTRNAKYAVAIAMMSSAVYLGADRLMAQDFGAYNCCGNGGCTVLTSTAACPNGQSDCANTASSTTCCTNRCNSP